MDAQKTSFAAVGFSSLPFQRQIGLLVGLAGAIALGVVVALWSVQPNYRPLFTNLNANETNDVIDVLQQSGIAYKIDHRNGAIMVDGDDIHDARIKLASEGLPKGNGNAIENFANSGRFGSSEFVESARYRNALESELARTITNFRSVKSARVHLAIPKTSGFLRNKRKPSASVFIDIYSGSGLSSEKVAAIVHLVASSIPGLDSDDVTVVDNRGNLLTEGDSSPEIAAANRMLKYRHQVESTYVDKIQDILIPMLGSGSVKARVSADIDFTSTEQTSESYNPDLPALRSEQMMRESKSAGSAAGGVPGALSNQPNKEAEAARVGGKVESSNPIEDGSRDKRIQSTKNYELDKTISHIQKQPGRIHRLTVAVVVDNKRVVDEKSSKVTYEPLQEEELARITTLVKDAIGFNAARGDSVNVINSAFAKAPPIEKLPELSFYQQSWFWEIIKQVIAGLFILLLLFMVLIPTIKSLASKPVSNPMLGNNGGEGALADAGSGAPAAIPANPEQQMNMIKNIAATDPKGMAQVVKTWVDG